MKTKLESEIASFADVAHKLPVGWDIVSIGFLLFFLCLAILTVWVVFEEINKKGMR